MRPLRYKMLKQFAFFRGGGSGGRTLLGHYAHVWHRSSDNVSDVRRAKVCVVTFGNSGVSVPQLISYDPHWDTFHREG